MPMHGQPAYSAASTSINSASAGKHLVVVNNTNTSSASGDDLINKALGPVIQNLGIEFASFVDQKINKKDASNIKMNSDPVLEKIGPIHPDDISTNKKEKIFDWMKEASSIDPEKNKEIAAAWQAALADVLSSDDYRMMNVIKNFNSHEVKQLLLISEDLVEDRTFGKKLEILGMAESNIYDSKTTYRLIQLLSILLIITVTMMAMSETLPAYLSMSRTGFGDDNRFIEQMRILTSGIKWIMPIFVLSVSFSYFGKIVKEKLSYRLNKFGIEIRRKVLEYVPSDSRTNR